MSDRKPQVGDDVELVLRGRVGKAGSLPEDDLVIARNTTGYGGVRYIYLRDANEVRVLGPQPQMGEVWQCLVRGLAAPLDLFCYSTHNENYWQAKNGQRYLGNSADNGMVTPLRRVYPA